MRPADDRVAGPRRAAFRRSGALAALLGTLLSIAPLAASGVGGSPPLPVCSAYGQGYFAVAGSEACIRIGGRVRVEVGSARPRERARDAVTFRALGRFALEARSPSELGLVRSVLRLELNRSRGGDFVDVDKAFVEVAGITAGRASSFFDFYQNDLDMLGLAGSSLPSINLLAYTRRLGDGLFASLSVEDPSERRFPVGPTAMPGVLASDPLGNPVERTFDTRQRQRWPDLVAALRLDRPWGLLQASGALHVTDPIDAGRFAAGRGETVGFAVQAGIRLDGPVVADRRDALWLQAAYGRGALSYVLSGFARDADNVSLGNRFAVDTFDAVTTRFGTLQFTEGGAVVAAVLHHWTPTLRQAAFAGLSRIRYAGALRGPFGPFGTGLDTAASPLAGGLDPYDDRLRSYDLQQIGTNLVYSPVRDLSVGVEVLYSRLSLRRPAVDQNVTPFLFGARPASPATERLVRFDDEVRALIRLQRDF